MFSHLHIVLGSVLYLGCLFALARWGDSLRESTFRRFKPIVVGLAVTIYCSAWSYYGVASQALENGWYFPPTFLGSILLLFFCAPLLKKMIAEAKRMNVTSIADYLAVSYGRSRSLAILITLVSVAILIPYIALQLKAIAQNYHLLSDGLIQESLEDSRVHSVTALVMALILGGFAIAFGTRHLDSREHHNGLMVAIAFEAIIKLVAFVALSVFVASVMFDGVEDIFIQVAQNPELSEAFAERRDQHHGFITAVILGVFATVCLPRQFHVLVVESNSDRDLNTVRWMFPFYLIVFGLSALPIAYAGSLIFQGLNISSEQYVLGLPMVADNQLLAFITYLGGFSAGSSMVIVACVAISTMVCNELVVPFLLRTNVVDIHKQSDARNLLRNIRRLTILGLVLLAYGYYALLSNHTSLGTIGLLSFSLVAQFAPCLFFNVILKPDRREHLAKAAVVSLCIGCFVWFYCILLPTILPSFGGIYASFVDSGPFGVGWLKPTALFGIDGLNLLAHGVFWSLLCNVLCFVYLSKNPGTLFKESSFSERRTITLLELRILLTRFLGVDQANLALSHYPDLLHGKGEAGSEDVRIVENILSGVIGSISARQVIEHSFSGEKHSQAVIDKATQVFQFGRELLQESIDNISQGISVVDAQQKLVSWNRSYLEIFNYPDGMVHVGRKISDLIRFNAEQNGLSEEEMANYVDKRLRFMASGSAYVHTYVHHDGTVLEIQGAQMGEGGYVTTFTDITKYKETVSALEDARETLETRVKERTEQLQSANRKLKEANKNKTHFLAAAGHDLIQPLNAAKLFSTALTHKVSDSETKTLLNNLEHSLHSADAIISELLAIAKLDSGEMRVNPQTFSLGDLFNSLKKEFSIIAQKKGLELHCIHSSLPVNTDEKLLKRVLQNLLSNAIRYTRKGKVLLGCRRKGKRVLIEVWDQGKGIPEKEKEAIFKEFHRLDKNMQDGGLGLGLATVQRLCELLDIQIQVDSAVDKGSVFRLDMPVAEKRFVSAYEDDEPEDVRASVLSGTQVLCIDNEQAILDGMKAVLEAWGCVFHGVTEWPDDIPWEPDALLVDYHLNDGVTGIELAEKFQAKFGSDKPVVVISADRNNDVRAQAKSRAFFFLRKPLKSASLWSVLARINDMKSLEGTVVKRP